MLALPGIGVVRDDLGALVEQLPEGCRQRSGRLFYLALAPALFGPVVAALSSYADHRCNLIVDILYYVVDPRLRVARAGGH